MCIIIYRDKKKVHNWEKASKKVDSNEGNASKRVDLDWGENLHEIVKTDSSNVINIKVKIRYILRICEIYYSVV